MSAATTAGPPVVGQAGLLSVLAGTDHKRTARSLLVLSGVFFLVGGLMALLIRAQLAQPNGHLVTDSTYNALFTMHGSTMIYLVVVPLALGLGLYLVPLQIGAADVAAPRAALAGLWLYALGGVTMLSGFLTRGGPGRASWIGIDPLSDAVHSPGSGMDLWIIGVILVTAGELAIAWCVLLSALRLRAPGMTLLRMPPLTWTMVVTCLMTVVAFPVLVVAMALLLIDRAGGAVLTGNSGALVYQHLFWFYGHPVVYVMFFPFVGAVAEVIAVFSRRRFFGHRAFAVSLLAFAALSTSVWAHHMFTTGQVTNRYFALTSIALVVPGGIEYFDLIATMWGGRISLRVPMLFALAFLVQFLVGGLSGVFIAAPPLDYHVNNSFLIVGHFHYTLFAGSLFGAFAALYFWYPKLTGRMLDERLGRVHFALVVLGTNLTFAPMLVLGQEGMTRRVAHYPAAAGWGTLNLIASVGSAVIAVSILVLIANLWRSRRGPALAGPDPWGGHSLEWATASPPPRHNFDALPPVLSHAPLLDLQEQAVAEARA